MNKTLSPEAQKKIDSMLKKCYSCGKCTSGCPMAPEMDFPPSIFVKRLALGEFDKIIVSRTIWVCSSCQNCYSRCPFEINIPEVIDLLKEHVYENKKSCQEKPTQLFHRIFLASIGRFGRIHEAGFIGEWKLFSGKWFSDLSLGMKMFLKGKLSPFPEKVRKRKEIKKLFRDAQKEQVSKK